MQLIFPCPKCSETVRLIIAAETDAVSCPDCGWSREITAHEIQGGRPRNCLACACGDLWRQKDFPPILGVVIVSAGVIMSTIAWQAYLPVTAIAILMGFAAVDLLLYWLMRDVLVCYRCGSRHRHTNPDDQYLHFELETAERYRQEAKRLEETTETKQ